MTKEKSQPPDGAPRLAEGVDFWQRATAHLWQLNAVGVSLAQLRHPLSRLPAATQQLRAELERTRLRPASQQALRAELAAQRDLLAQASAQIQAARVGLEAALREVGE